MAEVGEVTEHECQESYQECMAARRARIVNLIKEADPWETDDDLAEKAGVHRNTVLAVKRRSQSAQGCADCNNPPDEEPAANDLGNHQNIKALEKILRRCSKAELAYAVSTLLPAYRKVLKRISYRRHHHAPTSTHAAENNPAYAAD